MYVAMHFAAAAQVLLRIEMQLSAFSFQPSAHSAKVECINAARRAES
jgi:hypothetical protein